MGRRFAILAVVCSALAVVSGTSASVAREARVSCHAKALTLFFWPNGHNAIPSINFPQFPYPHMEVYKSGGGYPDQNFVAGVGFASTGQPYGGFVKACTTVRTKLINSRPATAKTNQAVVLQCTFSKPAQLEIGNRSTTPASVSLRVVSQSKKATAPLEVSAVFTDQTNGSTLRYDPKRCKASPPPQQ